ncbi:MAG: anhydro-N-acetylmuramic acid kinase [Ulvibacter sp.]|nr:anhydro-N-acetylmuramic acid kinase [Ulvibacter sp.]|tara:strand:+ start:3769 stop:4827 length:1059 start_codon:yes stop_codon:yes gene_type:complete
MKKQSYKVLGVMSGTSLDGVDLALCYFDIQKNITYKMPLAKTIAYSTYWRSRLLRAVDFSSKELVLLDLEYTKYLGDIIKTFIADNNIKDLDAVCSHGHTVLHRPDQGVTLQIGNLEQISKNIQQTVVCDFRVQDLLFGGQGAPLVPLGDRLLFSQYDYCLNLGGFANISKVSSGVSVAYDICPVNVVMNHYAQKLAMPYDSGGELAKSGEILPTILKQLDALSYYRQHPPKSLGVEWVYKELMPILKASKAKEEDVLRTCVAHFASQIVQQLNPGSSVLVTGGGGYNRFLLEQIQASIDVTLVLPNKTLIEFKEALIFGLLGVLKLRDEVNCLSSVTGASKDHSSGVVFLN